MNPKTDLHTLRVLSHNTPHLAKYHTILTKCMPLQVELEQVLAIVQIALSFDMQQQFDQHAFDIMRDC
jgi:hypothetical protein